MGAQNIQFVFQWWLTFLILGLVFLPLTSLIFKKFNDLGYLFSKIIGLIFVSYTLFLLGTIKILPFSIISIITILWIFALINFFIFRKLEKKPINTTLIIFEEIIFLIGIIIWSYVRGNEPSINGLEKFMDFGFLNSILRSNFIPVQDMWLAGNPINYYYFGHFSTAVLTKLSFLSPQITFNLMIATIFSFSFGLTFSIVSNLIGIDRFTKKSFIAGILGGLLLTIGGNLHMIYGLFKSYNVESPVPFWKLPLLITSFPNGYWYPNATRFIPFTIHEFPLYSFVVSDLHGHVLDIPFVLLTIAITYTLLTASTNPSNFKISFIKNKLILKNIYEFTSDFWLRIVLVSFLLAAMYMTNAWDGAIYLLLLSVVLVIRNVYTLNKFSFKNLETFILRVIKPLIASGVLFIIFSFPFNAYFKPFASGVGILCSPSFMTKIGNIGPILFEQNHCQKSEWWQILILYGFFYFFVLSFFVFILKYRKKIKILPEDFFILALIIISTILIIIPEFIYLKDIYPQHYRANTMFKLVYQSFMMLSIVSSYVIVRIISKTRNIFFYIATVILVVPILIYPYFAIKSYYADLKKFDSLDGLKYLETRLPEDYAAINWINKNIKGRPVIVEAQGDSYTDFGRISSNTGLPTILGWTVHEWLWHGTYDVPAPKITEIKNIYEDKNIDATKKLLKKYNTEYVYIGVKEYEKYPDLYEEKFKKLGKIIYQSGQTKIYLINK